jgi:hypothetical protein
VLLPATLQSEQTSPHYAVAITPTPVFNAPRFKEIFGNYDGNSLKTDNCGQVRELEFIALPGTSFHILQEISDRSTTIFRVKTSDYSFDAPTGLFIDSRFVRTADSPFPPRPKIPPGNDEIIRRLRSLTEVQYVWGGNVSNGVAQLIDFYPPREPVQLSVQDLKRWKLAGLDCSGLLYEATGGSTPRNTSALVTFGKPVDIEGLRLTSIVRKLKPLDLIVWPGHILIVLDRGEVIESRLYCDGRRGRVLISPIKERLKEILTSRKPLNSLGTKERNQEKGFVVRRWDAVDVRQGPD